jgi:hypothetical protein
LHPAFYDFQEEWNMFTKKLLASVLFATTAIGTVAMPLPSVAAVDVYVNRAPPPPRSERVPAARRGYVWAPGYWNWRGNRHVWVAGSWARERPGYAYRPHQWVERDGRWNLQRGGWDRGNRDSDRDGVPDRRDSRPNNPNRQ